MSQPRTTKHHFIATAVLVIAALACIAVLLLGAADLVMKQRTNTWINKVQIACQPGSSEKHVRTLLGEPSSVKSEPLPGIVPPAVEPAKTERVLLYWHVCWVAHVYIGKDGAVVGYHIGSS